MKARMSCFQKSWQPENFQARLLRSTSPYRTTPFLWWWEQLALQSNSDNYLTTVYKWKCFLSPLKTISVRLWTIPRTMPRMFYSTFQTLHKKAFWVYIQLRCLISVQRRVFYQIFTIVTLIYSHCLEINISTQNIRKILKTDLKKNKQGFWAKI